MRRTAAYAGGTITNFWGFSVFKLRRFGVSMIAAGLALGLVGCSDSGDVATGEGTSAEQTTAEQTTQTPEPAVPVLTEENFASKLAAAQAEAGSAHFEATIEASGQSGNMSGDIDNLGDLENVAMDMSFDIGAEQLEIVVLDRALYVKGAGMSAAPGKPWIKVDVRDPNNPFSQLFEATNPANFTAYLEGVTRFKDMGIESVNGVETRHYSVTVDTDKMLAANPAFEGQDTSTLGLPDEVTTEVYVDSDNLPIKMSVGMGSAGTFEANFSKYGEPVDVEAPPANKVSEFSL